MSNRESCTAIDLLPVGTLLEGFEGPHLEVGPHKLLWQDFNNGGLDNLPQFGAQARNFCLQRVFKQVGQVLVDSAGDGDE